MNLPVRRTLETVYENYKGDRTTAEWKALEKYLKKVWFANGIHHHYSNDKFVPEFTEGYLLDAIETIPEEKFGSLNSCAARSAGRSSIRRSIRRSSTRRPATTCCSPRRATTTTT